MRKSGSKHRKAERKTEKKAGPSKLASNLIGRATTEPKIFVLDTNVLIHDPTSLYRFEEHDVFIPMMTLEELDAHKTGGSEVARNARQTSRLLDEIVSKCEHTIKEGVELVGPSQGLATGKLILQTEEMNGALPSTLPKGKNGDNAILSVSIHLKGKFPKRRVVLVSKDINMRIKARALDIDAQDYFNDKVLEDTDLLYAGMRELPSNFWETHGKDLKSWKEEGRTFYQVQGPECSELVVNELVYFEPRADTSGKALYAMVRECGGRKATLSMLTEYTHQKNAVWGITARNREQNFALNLLMDPEIDFVTLLGQAGTGKTLLTLAAALTQTLETERYTEVIITRVTVSLGEDIGFLPGTEEEKMTPWMGAIEDNLDVLNHTADAGDKGDHGGARGGDWGRAATMDLIRSRLKVKSLNFMRGRTFLNKFLIIDEAQNLTPKQMKTLITRAGPGTKVVCLGNLAQIDTPYLTEGSSGLAYAVDRFKGWEHGGHITLLRGERSRLADHAAEVL